MAPSAKDAQHLQQWSCDVFYGTSGQYIGIGDAPFIPDPNIAGIGVILSFLLSAALVLILSIAAYWTGLVPEHLITPFDRRFYRARKPSVRTYTRAYQKCIYAFTDQQIVTGIAILVAGYVNEHIVAYHWLILTYLAWVSSTIHLLSLTVIGDSLHNFTFALVWRCIGMLSMFGLLLAALIATLDQRTREWPLVLAPMRCIWPYKGQSYYIGSSVFISLSNSLALTVFIWGYVWKVTSVIIWPNKFRSWIRTGPGRLLKNAIRKRARRRSTRTCGRRCCFSIYYLLLTLYSMMVLYYDFIHSFSAAIWLMLLATVWGSLNLINYRSVIMGYVPDSALEQENRWDYGQMLPMLLLALPILTMVEQFFHALRIKKREAKNLRPDSTALEFDVFETKGSDPSSSTLNLASTNASSSSIDHLKKTDKNGDGKFFSQLFIEYDANEEMVSELSPQHAYLYTSKLFYGAFVLLQVYLVASIVAMFFSFNFTGSIFYPIGFPYWIFGLSLLGGTPTLTFFVFGFGLPFSKLGR